MRPTHLTVLLVSLISLVACSSSAPPDGDHVSSNTVENSVSASPSNTAIPTSKSPAPSPTPIVATENPAIAESPVSTETSTAVESTSPAVTDLALYPLADGTEVATALSPTKNIACEIYEEYARCSVLSLAEESSAAPGEIGIPGWSFAVNKQGEVYDTLWNQAPTATLDSYKGKVLPYSSQAIHGEFSITSEESGITLVHEPTGHGAFFRAQGIEIF